MAKGIAKALDGREAILDGELVCLDDQGRSVFSDLMHNRGRVYYYAFDLLWLDGVDLRGRPLGLRKEQLRELIAEHQIASRKLKEANTRRR